MTRTTMPTTVPTRPSTKRTLGAVATAAVLGLALSACSVTGGPEGEATKKGDGSPGQVVLLTHDSFSLPDELVEKFESDTGQKLVVRASGDAGSLATSLALTAGNPTGDVAFGVDNTYASRPLEAGVFARYEGTRAPGSEQFDLPGGEDRLTPVDTASVCVNVDTTWFEKKGVPAPETLADLTEPAYRDLMVTPAPTTSSPGMAFLLTTVAEYGDDWADYWKDLHANGLKVVDGWNDAYYTDFTAGGEKGTRPIVLSYDSSPAFTVSKDGKSSTTAALLDTCFRQVEYAGVLEGTGNREGAEALVDFLASPEVQAALPESMYVFGVSDEVTLPTEWAKFAVQPEKPYTVAPEEIAANREAWLTEWTDLQTR